MRRTFLAMNGLFVLAVSATAQISGDEAMRICRDAIRKSASNRLNASNIEFRSTQLSEKPGTPDRVEGTFAVYLGEKPEMHTYSCSVDTSGGNLQSAQIDSKNAVTALVDSANERAYTNTDLIDKCRSAVRKKIFDHGYIGMRVNSLSVDKSPESGDRVDGTVTAETGGNRNLFKFSCEIIPSTGVVRSIQLIEQP